uniref:Uncharacterized protein n=1 Tax=viral metagenome TaxID=1070528 RepID=A0A6M3J3Z2_9ZZZZ
MRIYLDVQPTSFVLDPEEILPLSRYDITGFTKEEEEAELKDIAVIMGKQEYTIKRHLCGHDEGMSCTMKVIKGV